MATDLCMTPPLRDLLFPFFLPLSKSCPFAYLTYVHSPHPSPCAFAYMASYHERCCLSVDVPASNCEASSQARVCVCVVQARVCVCMCLSTHRHTHTHRHAVRTHTQIFNPMVQWISPQIRENVETLDIIVLVKPPFAETVGGCITSFLLPVVACLYLSWLGLGIKPSFGSWVCKQRAHVDRTRNSCFLEIGHMLGRL